MFGSDLRIEPYAPNGSYRAARYPCLLTFGEWRREIWKAQDFQHVSMFFYRCTHSPDEQARAYEESCQRTGLRWHDEGPEWLKDPTAICCAPGDGYPTRFHHAILQRDYRHDLHRLQSLYGDPWEIPRNAWDGLKWHLRMAALCLFFIGLSLPEFRMVSLCKITAQELDRMVYDGQVNLRRSALNGWGGAMDHELGLSAASGRHAHGQPHFANHGWNDVAPKSGVYFMDRGRAHIWGEAVRGLDVVTRVAIPNISGRFHPWLSETSETFERIAPGRRVILAGDKLYCATTEDAVAFKLAAATG